MEGEEKTIVICGQDNYTGADSIDVNCRKCNLAVILSDSTIRSLKQNKPDLDIVKDPPIVLCIECGMTYIEEQKNGGEEIKVIPLSAEQIEEFKEGLSKFK